MFGRLRTTQGPGDFSGGRFGCAGRRCRPGRGWGVAIGRLAGEGAGGFEGWRGLDVRGGSGRRRIDKFRHEVQGGSGFIRQDAGRSGRNGLWRWRGVFGRGFIGEGWSLSARAGLGEGRGSSGRQGRLHDGGQVGGEEPDADEGWVRGGEAGGQADEPDVAAAGLNFKGGGASAAAEMVGDNGLVDDGEAPAHLTDRTAAPTGPLVGQAEARGDRVHAMVIRI